MQSQNTSLVGLPRELLDNIARSLPTKDFNALRSTSKAMEDKIFPYWANSFFKKRQFSKLSSPPQSLILTDCFSLYQQIMVANVSVIDSFSLKTLVDISEHESLSKVIVHVIIGLDDFMGVDPRGIQIGEEFNQWRSAAYAQQTLLLSGVAANILSTALRNLPNLKTVDIRDFDSPTRYRDAVEQQPRRWRSYGYSNHEQWRHALISIGPRASFCGYVFQAVLAALDQSSPELESLEVILKQRNFGLSEDAFALFPVLGAGITRTLHSLTKLHLDLKTGWMFGGGLPYVADFYNTPQTATTYLRGFLRLATNVTWLRLNFLPSADRSEIANSLFGWLGLDPDPASPSGDTKWNEFNPAPVALPLRRLDIGNVNSIKIDVLCKTLAKFSDLENISIKETVLEMTTDQSAAQGHFGNEDTDEDGDSIWASFIRGLYISNPKLKHLMLSNLYQKYRNQFDRVVFYNGDNTNYRASLSMINDDHAKLKQLAKETWTTRGLGNMQSKREDRQALDSEDEDLDDPEDEDEDEEEVLNNDED